MNETKYGAVLTRIMKLLAVKSIMTIALTAGFIFLSVTGVIAGDKFYDVFLIVVSFYFGTQAKKE